MSAAPKKLLTPAEYLAIERQAETKSEYLNGEMFAMARCTFSHNLVKENLAGEMGRQLREGACEVITSDMCVKVEATGLFTYPDIVVVCDKPKFEDDHNDTLVNPRVLVEVLSDSTEGYDRGKKFQHYKKIPTLQEYVLVSQNQMLVERFVRQADGTWNNKDYAQPEEVLEFTSIPVKVPLSDIYRGVALPEPPSR